VAKTARSTATKTSRESAPVAAPTEARISPTSPRGTIPAHVVDDGGVQNDLSLAGPKKIELREHSRGDADGCRGQGRADEYCDQVAVSESARHRVPSGERRGHPDDGDRHRGQADAQQPPDVGLQADLEEQKNDADLGEQPDGFRQRNQTQKGGAEQDAGKKLPQNRRLSDALGELTEEPRSEERRCEREQERTEIDAGVHSRIVDDRAVRFCA